MTGQWNEPGYIRGTIPMTFGFIDLAGLLHGPYKSLSQAQAARDLLGFELQPIAGVSLQEGETWEDEMWKAVERVTE